MSKQQVKVIEVIGQKLDPKAKYIFAFNAHMVSTTTVSNFAKFTDDLIGPNFVVVMCEGDPKGAMKVFEVMPKEAK